MKLRGARENQAPSLHCCHFQPGGRHHGNNSCRVASNWPCRCWRLRCIPVRRSPTPNRKLSPDRGSPLRSMMAQDTQRWHKSSLRNLCITNRLAMSRPKPVTSSRSSRAGADQNVRALWGGSARVWRHGHGDGIDAPGHRARRPAAQSRSRLLEYLGKARRPLAAGRASVGVQARAEMKPGHITSH